MKFLKIILLLEIFLLFFTGCEESGVTMIKEDSDTAVSIPILLRSDPESGDEEYKELIETFNKRYSGKYRVVVNPVREFESGYRDRLKLLNAYEELPLIITDVAFSADFQELMVHNGRFLDVRPYLEGKEEWKTFLTNAPDKIYMIPLSKGLFSSAGFFYNKKLFHQAGIEKFPETWDDFFHCLKKLKKKGIIPLALHGSGEYWASMLISTAYMCASDAGKNFMEEYFPDSYDNQGMRALLECMGSIYDYTFEDSLEINFNQAQERFLDGKAAILANGYWMLSDVEKSGNREIGFACFPGQMLMVDEQMSSWALISGYSEDEIKGAVEFLTYRHKNSESDRKGASELEREYISVFESTNKYFGNYQLRWEEKLLNDFFNSVFPDFIQRDVDEAEVIKEMDEELKKIRNARSYIEE